MKIVVVDSDTVRSVEKIENFQANAASQEAAKKLENEEHSLGATIKIVWVRNDISLWILF